MHTALFDVYRAVHEQAFIPIFVEDDFETGKLIEACLKAGCKCIEYTLRRRDAHKMIPWILEQYPELYLLVGSTIDDETIVKKMKEKYPHLLTIQELGNMGVDGFVSMIGWSFETIRKYSKEHLVIPTAMTVTEALQQVGSGAHFIKNIGPDLGFTMRCRAAAAFDYCPIMLTGGICLDRIPQAISAGAIILASGFDLMLKEKDPSIRESEIASVIKTYLDNTKRVRNTFYPMLADAQSKERQEWLSLLPHYHSF